MINVVKITKAREEETSAAELPAETPKPPKEGPEIQTQPAVTYQQRHLLPVPKFKPERHFCLTCSPPTDEATPYPAKCLYELHKVIETEPAKDREAWVRLLQKLKGMSASEVRELARVNVKPLVSKKPKRLKIDPCRKKRSPA